MTRQIFEVFLMLAVLLGIGRLRARFNTASERQWVRLSRSRVNPVPPGTFFPASPMTFKTFKFRPETPRELCKYWSGREGLNLGLHASKAGSPPGCNTSGPSPPARRPT